jgi:hypothetical protein
MLLVFVMNIWKDGLMQEEAISILYLKNAEWLEEENSLHIKGIAKPNETD